MNHSVLLRSLGILCLVALAGCAASQSAKDLNQTGYRLIGQERYWEAVIVLTEAIETMPDNPALYMNRAEAYKEQGEYEKALDDYDRAIDLAPEIAINHKNRGSLLFRMKRYDDALKEYDRYSQLGTRTQKAEAQVFQALVHKVEGRLNKARFHCNAALELDPQQVTAYTQLAEVAFEEKDWSGALSYLDSALRIDPSLLDARIKRGLMYWYDKNFEKALEDVNTAISMKPDQGDAYYARGKILASMGKYEDALMDYNRVVLLAPSAGVYRERGLALMELGQWKESFRDFEACLRLDKTDAVAWERMGNLWLGVKEVRKALTCYSKALEYGTSNALLVCRNITLMVSLGELEAAIAFGERALPQVSKLDCAYGNLAEAYRKAGKHDQALEAFRKGVSASPSSPELHWRYANALLEKGKTAEAMVHCNQALELDPANFSARYVLSNLLYTLGKYEETIAQLNRLEEVHPEKHEIYRLRSACYSQLRESALAEQDWETYLELRPQEQ